MTAMRASCSVSLILLIIMDVSGMNLSEQVSAANNHRVESSKMKWKVNLFSYAILRPL